MKMLQKDVILVWLSDLRAKCLVANVASDAFSVFP